jgi:hypothetical protein
MVRRPNRKAVRSRTETGFLERVAPDTCVEVISMRGVNTVIYSEFAGTFDSLSRSFGNITIAARLSMPQESLSFAAGGCGPFGPE